MTTIESTLFVSLRGTHRLYLYGTDLRNNISYDNQLYPDEWPAPIPFGRVRVMGKILCKV